MTEEKVWQLLAELVASQKKTDEQLAKTDAKVDRIAEMLGGISNNQGKIAEDFFYNSLQHNPVLAGKRFEIVDRNLLRSSQKLREEYDILLYNGDSVFIIEVKYRAHPRDLTHLIERKGANFPRLFPQFRDFQRHLGLATFSIDDEVLQAALRQGVTILQRRGDVIETTPATV